MAKVNLEVKVTEMPKVKKIIADLIEENERLRNALLYIYNCEEGAREMWETAKEALEK